MDNDVLLELKVPLPPLQIPVVEPTVIDPLIATLALLAQTDLSGPMATIGAPVSKILTVSTT